MHALCVLSEGTQDCSKSDRIKLDWIKLPYMVIGSSAGVEFQKDVIERGGCDDECDFLRELETQNT